MVAIFPDPYLRQDHYQAAALPNLSRFRPTGGTYQFLRQQSVFYHLRWHIFWQDLLQPGGAFLSGMGNNSSCCLCPFLCVLPCLRSQNRNSVFVNGSNSNSCCTIIVRPSISFRRSVYPQAGSHCFVFLSYDFFFAGLFCHYQV